MPWGSASVEAAVIRAFTSGPMRNPFLNRSIRVLVVDMLKGKGLLVISDPTSSNKSSGHRERTVQAVD